MLTRQASVNGTLAHTSLVDRLWRIPKMCTTKLSHSRGSLHEVRQKPCRVNPSLRQRCVSHLASKGIALVEMPALAFEERHHRRR